MYNYIGLEPRREDMHWQFGEMKFGEMKRNTSNWSNFGMLLLRAGLTASAGLSCTVTDHIVYRVVQTRRVNSVLRPRQHSIGYMGDGFYRSKDPTNSIKVLKEMLQKEKENNENN